MKVTRGGAEERMFLLLKDIRSRSFLNKPTNIRELAKAHKVTNNFTSLIEARGLLNKVFIPGFKKPNYKFNCGSDDHNLKYYATLLLQDDREYQVEMRRKRALKKQVEAAQQDWKKQTTNTTKLENSTTFAVPLPTISTGSTNTGSYPITKQTLLELGEIIMSDFTGFEIVENNTVFFNVKKVTFSEKPNKDVLLQIFFNKSGDKYCVSCLNDSKLFWFKKSDSSMRISSKQF